LASGHHHSNLGVINSVGIQESIFSQGEGDQWFKRNLAEIEDLKHFHDVEFILDRLNPFKNQISRILEVGCAAGHKVEQLASELEAEPFGIDPSEKAIRAAIERTNNSKNFVVGTVDRMDFLDSSFDTVFVAFCMYLVSREELEKAIREIDRVLTSGGFLIIEDFDPGTDHKVAYSHHGDITTYKSDYAKLFLNLGKYYLLEKQSFSHSSKHFTDENNERISIQILHKNRIH
jgi:ubiquinone/menaquinone biosynthesis C-methylase UbiE